MITCCHFNPATKSSWLRFIKHARQARSCKPPSLQCGIFPLRNIATTRPITSPPRSASFATYYLEEPVTLSDQYGKIDIHSLNPLFVTIDDFCDADEILKIQNFTRTQEFMPFQVTTAEGMTTDRNIRSATGAEPTEETARIFGPVRERAAELVNFTINASEPTALLKYEVGEEYKNHFDTAADPESATFGRCFTAVLYINDDFEGGETRFPRLDLGIKPKAGRLALWSNKRPNDTDPHPLSLHAGLPVTAGTKWIATFWIHRGVVGQNAAPAAVSAP